MTNLMRNPHATHIDYGFMQGLISENPNFVPSNIDGIIERNGVFLVFEWKRPKEKISKGQEILLKALAKTHGFTVVIMCGDTDNGLNFDHCWILDKQGNPTTKYATYDEFLAFYKFWYSVA